jgi:UDP-N-acetylmuramoyl-L-alanyl-D-glutamate--2,6-diaminopimelate ligase
VQLQALLDDVEVRAVLGAPVDVRSVTHDSRAVAPGSLFCCVVGATTDGHQFAGDAIAAGASALLVDHQLDVHVTQVVVDDVRVAMGRAAAAFYGDPSRSLDIVGITGTNGKTTVAWLLRSVLEASGRRTEYIGTLTSKPGDPPTTPDAPELQAMLARMRDDGVQALAMEVSSHALAQSRVEGTRFKVAVFTNLTRDHLDFHPTMEDYFAAKARLFEPGRADVGVVNADDPRGQLLLDAARIPTRAYSLGDLDEDGRWRGRQLTVPLAGRFNVSNALAVATAALELGIDEDTIVAGIAAAPQVPGRMERVEAGQPFEVIVDYAHSPDGIENVLAAAREMTDGRVIAVFGAGGDKDREKRPMMGEAAARLADVVVLTSDNPRSEDPMAIIDAIRGGTTGATEVLVEPDRRGAIELALARAEAGDVVVIAGKGHETTQVIGVRTLAFDDRVVARELLS